MLSDVEKKTLDNYKKDRPIETPQVHEAKTTPFECNDF